MSFAHLASVYVTSHLLLSMAFVCAIVATHALRVLGHPLSPRIELKWNCFLLLSVAAISILHPLLPRAELFEPLAKVWISPTAQGYEQTRRFEVSAATLVLSGASQAHFSAHSVSNLAGLAALLLVILRLGLFARDVTSLQLLRSRGFLIRRIHSVRVYVSREIRIPCRTGSRGKEML